MTTRAWQKQLREQMPWVGFSYDGHCLELPAGDANFFRYSTGDARAIVIAFDLRAHLQLIDGLIRRYNWRLQQLNEQAKQIPPIAEGSEIPGIAEAR